MKVTKERLSYLKQAQYVQRLAEPYIRKGKLPLWKIHTKFVIEEAPVSLNTFRKMLKEDVSHLNEKIEIYRKQMEEQIPGPQPRHTGRRRCGPFRPPCLPCCGTETHSPEAENAAAQAPANGSGDPQTEYPRRKHFRRGNARIGLVRTSPLYTSHAERACDGTDVIYT